MSELSHTKDSQAVAAELYAALNGIFIEELNGRLCALPDTLPDPGFDGDTPRESKCCPACAKHWWRTKRAIKSYEDWRWHHLRNPEGVR